MTKPQWFHPVRESLGDFLLGTRNYAEAEKVFRADLERNKKSGRSLFGLIESLKGQEKSFDAVQREFSKRIEERRYEIEYRKSLARPRDVTDLFSRLP